MTDPEAMDLLYVFKCPEWDWPSKASAVPGEYEKCDTCGADYEEFAVVPAANLTAAREEVERLRGAGDLLQSSASRLAEWVNQQDAPPYEVRMAALEGEDAVKDWTAARAALDTTGEGGTDARDS